MCKYILELIYKTFQSKNINMKKKVIKSKAKFQFRNCFIRDVLFEHHGAVDPFGWAVWPYSSLLSGISILTVFQNLRWNSNKTSLYH